MEGQGTMTPKHQPKVEMSQSVPPDVEAGIDLMLQVRVSCPSGCDLRGKPVIILASDGLVMTSELVTYDEKVNETEALRLKAPSQVAEHTWSVSVPGHEAEGVVHEESSLVIAFRTNPHAPTMAVWDVPSPVVMGTSFGVKVGVKCSAACPMTGGLVEVRDEEGRTIGEGRLSETPWPDTTALHAAEVDLIAPGVEGMFSWSADFCAEAVEPPHFEASARFSFRTAKPPEHRVTIRVVSGDEEAPLENAEVRLGAYRASTDRSGLATLELPKGTYDLNVWKVGYKTSPGTVAVAQDVTVQVEAVAVPDTDSDDEYVWM